MSLGKRLFGSAFFGCGVAALLFGSSKELPPEAYLSIVPFWPTFMLPSGLFWNTVWNHKMYSVS